MPKLSLATRLISNQASSYPDLSITDPTLKTAEYIAQYGQAHVCAYLSSGRMEWHGNPEASDRLAYAQGRQEATKYRRLRTENQRLDKVGSRLDLRILKVVPKYIKTISGLLDEAEYFASCNTIDGLAEDMKKAYESGLRAQMESGDKLAQVGVNMSPDGQPAPLDEDEIQLRMLQYQNEEALRMEADLELGNYDANIKQVLRKCNMYNAIFGRSCIYNYRTLGKCVPQALEPWRVLLLPSEHEDYSDLRAGAHLVRLTVGQLRSEAGDELTVTEYRNLAIQGRKASGLGWQDITARGNFDDAINSLTIDVIRFGFYSWNEDEKGKYWAWYEGNLIIDSDLYYGCRMAYNQLYDMTNPGAVLAPYIPVVPDQLAGYSLSVTDEVMSPADFVQRQWIKLQDELNRSVPKGFAYDLDRIEDVVLSNNKKLSKEEVIEMFERSGRWVHTGVTADGTKDGNIGLRELGNGISADVLTLFDLLVRGIDLIERMTGVNGAVAAGNAGSRVAVGSLEIAKDGAANALKFLFSAQQSLFERTCRVMASHYRQQELLEKGTDSGYGAHRFRLKVEQLPTKEEKDKFAEIVKAALDAGAIDVLDVALIEQVKNPRMGRIVLAARAKRKQADAQAAEQAKAENEQKMQAQASADKLNELKTLRQMDHDFQLQLQRDRDKAETARTVLLARIKSDADQAIEYYRALSTMHNTALAGSWKAALGAIPKPNGGEAGVKGATNTATLAALMPSLAPEMATLPPAPQPEPAPEPTPDEMALQQMMQPQDGGVPADMAAAPDAMAQPQMMPA